MIKEKIYDIKYPGVLPAINHNLSSPDEYSGIESYVKKQIDMESVLWFPMGRSLKIEEWENNQKT